MARVSVTTPAQQAEARLIADSTGRKYSSVLRALQRASTSGKAGKQTRSGAKLLQTLESSQRPEAAKIASELKNEQLKQGIVGGKRRQKPPAPARQRYKTNPGAVVLESNLSGKFYVSAAAGMKAVKSNFILFQGDTRRDAIAVAREYQHGIGDHTFANIVGKTFSLEFRKAGTKFRVRKRSTQRGKRAYSTDYVQDTGAGGQWFVILVDKIDGKEKDNIISTQMKKLYDARRLKGGSSPDDPTGFAGYDQFDDMVGSYPYLEVTNPPGGDYTFSSGSGDDESDYLQDQDEE